MPITFIFAGLLFLGIILAVSLIPVSIVLLILKKKMMALMLFIIPVSLIVISISLTLLIFSRIWLNDFIVNLQPSHIFKATFGLSPDAQTEVLQAYTKSGLDYETTVIKFKSTKEIVDKITNCKFCKADRETFMRIYKSKHNNLPDHVREWFTPTSDSPNLFYIAEPYNNSFGTVNEAILCYNEDSGIAYFHWVGLD